MASYDVGGFGLQVACPNIEYVALCAVWKPSLYMCYVYGY